LPCVGGIWRKYLKAKVSCHAIEVRMPGNVITASNTGEDRGRKVVAASFEKRTLAEHEQSMYVGISIPPARGALHRAYPCEIRGAFHGTNRA
jgi:hypothetical protein